jgi:hypothetical protein
MTLPSPLPPGLSFRETAVDAGCKTVSALTRNSGGSASGPLAYALDLVSGASRLS